jgi:hypothetical protein
MNFAHWRNIATVMGIITGPAGEHQRCEGRDVVAQHFVMDIPEGTTRDDVVASLLRKLFERGGPIIDDTDGLAFEEEWPQEVRRQFRDKSVPRWSWSSLK